MTDIVRPTLCVLPPLMLAFMPHTFDIKKVTICILLAFITSATFTTLIITYLSTAYTQPVVSVSYGDCPQKKTTFRVTIFIIYRIKSLT